MEVKIKIKDNMNMLLKDIPLFSIFTWGSCELVDSDRLFKNIQFCKKITIEF